LETLYQYPTYILSMVVKIKEDDINEWKKGIDLVLEDKLQGSKYDIKEVNGKEVLKYTFTVDGVEHIADEKMLELRCDDRWVTEDSGYKLIVESAYTEKDEYIDEFTIFNVIIGFTDRVVIEQGLKA